MRRYRHTCLTVMLACLLALVVVACGGPSTSKPSSPPSQPERIASTWTPKVVTRAPTSLPVLTPPKPASTATKPKISWVESTRRCIVHRESRGLYHVVNPSSGASGAYGFLDSTWRNVTGLPGKASDYSKKVQDRAFYKLFNNGAGKHHWYLKGGPQCW